jgi:uncharacterized phiE125 gp8 family phage protein
MTYIAPKYGWSKLVNPEREPLTLEEAKMQCRIDHDSEDALILSYITACRQRAENLTNRVFITQQWQMTLSSFPCEIIELPRTPVQSIDSIQYVGVDGVTQTLDYTLYVLDNTALPCKVYPSYNETWPTARLFPKSVLINATYGYGDYPRDVPEDVRQALRLMVAHCNENREEVVLGSGNVVDVLPAGVDSFLDRVRAGEFR